MAKGPEGPGPTAQALAIGRPLHIGPKGRAQRAIGPTARLAKNGKALLGRTTSTVGKRPKAQGLCRPFRAVIAVWAVRPYEGSIIRAEGPNRPFG